MQKEIRQLLCKRFTQLKRARGGAQPLALIFVAIKKIELEAGAELVLVAQKKEAVDDYIVTHASSIDLVVTRDILLAERLVQKDVLAINDRGVIFNRETIGEYRSMRDAMLVAREMGIAPPSARAKSWGPQEFKKFAASLDKCLNSLLKN